MPPQFNPFGTFGTAMNDWEPVDALRGETFTEQEITARIEQERALARIARDRQGRFAPRRPTIANVGATEWALDYMPKKSSVKKEDRKYEIRVEYIESKKIYHIKVIVVNDKDAVVDEYKVKTIAQMNDAVLGFVENYGGGTGYNPKLLDVRLRANNRARGHLTREQRARERERAVQDVVEEDTFSIDIEEEVVREVREQVGIPVEQIPF